MKVMLLVMDEQRALLDRLYEIVQQHSQSCTIFRLNRRQQQNLGRFLASVDYQNYDRVVIFLRFKRLAPQLNVLKCIPGLIFLEHDACQNYMDGSKYKGGYSRLYGRLPGSRALVSGAMIAKRFQSEGIDAVFVSKGYDEQLLQNLEQPRDIPVGFLGSIKSSEYAQRRALLSALAERTGMLVTRTASGAEYLQMLNRIEIFVSADIGMGEFMIKNFEAMACGCVLLAWSQGEEDRLLGFEDMHNVVFYHSLEDAIAKLELLRNDPALAQRIARNGQAFAEQRYAFSRVGRDLAQEIEQELRPWPKPSRLLRSWVKLRYGMKVPNRARFNYRSGSELNSGQDISQAVPAALAECLARAPRVVLVANNPAIGAVDFDALELGRDDVVVSFNACVKHDLLRADTVNLFVHGFNVGDRHFFGLPCRPEVRRLFEQPGSRCFTALVGCTGEMSPVPGVMLLRDRIPEPVLLDYPTTRPDGKAYAGPSTGFSTLVFFDALRERLGYGYELLALGFSDEAGKLWRGHAWDYEREWLAKARVTPVPLQHEHTVGARY